MTAQQDGGSHHGSDNLRHPGERSLPILRHMAVNGVLVSRSGIAPSEELEIPQVEMPAAARARRRSLRLLAISVSLVVLGSAGASYFRTDGGRIEITAIRMPTENGQWITEISVPHLHFAAPNGRDIRWKCMRSGGVAPESPCGTRVAVWHQSRLLLMSDVVLDNPHCSKSRAALEIVRRGEAQFAALGRGDATPDNDVLAAMAEHPIRCGS